MQLDAITGPDDLRERSHQELDDLCGQIRARIIEAVTARGDGHLGSNLGLVELTVALHRVFHSPHDVILWDTGHQAYVHKMLTGRSADFDSLRLAGGLSGYPSRTESPMTGSRTATPPRCCPTRMAWPPRSSPPMPGGGWWPSSATAP